MSENFNDAELEAYLEEALDPGRAVEIEQELRENPELLPRLSLINRRRDAGVHTLGEIWRRHQVSVPSLETLGQYLAGKLSAAQASYIQFRIEELKCRYTIAMLEGLDQQQHENSEQSKSRRKKIFDGSAGLLSPDQTS